MKRSMKWKIVFSLLAFYIAGISLAGTGTQVIPRVTDFIILVDESGSMFEYIRSEVTNKARIS